MEGTNEVLARRVVHGRLAAHGRIDVGQQGGGALDEAQSSQGRGCHEAGDVPYDAAAKGNDHAVPVDGRLEAKQLIAQILVCSQRLVLFAGGETAGAQTGAWYTSGKDSMTALSAKTGKVLWTAYHPPSGYRSPEDLLVADGLVWTGATTSGKAR